MPTTTDYKLKFTIDADGKKAKAELKGVEEGIKKLGSGVSGSFQKGAKEAASALSNVVGVFTGDRISGAASQVTSFAGAIGAIPGPTGLAVGAVAGFGAVVTGVGLGLFAAVKAASDFGSELHDMADKTGLSAEAISTLKFNADNAGSSLEAASVGVSKFGKLLGQAADGSDKAKATLKSLGITSNDLETAMNQAFVSISKLPEGVEQLTAAQKLFGKSGADLIPVIKQMGGSFTDAITEAKRLGVTLTEEDLKAADNFGDTLGQLGTQAKVMGSKFALEFAPMITNAMNQASKAISDHQADIKRAASNFESAAQGMIAISHDLSNAAHTVSGEYQKMPTAMQKAGDAMAALIIPGYGAVRLMEKLAEVTAKYLVLRGRAETAIANKFGATGEAGLAYPSTRAGDGLNRKFGYADPDADTGKAGGRGGGGGRGPKGKTPEQLERERIQGIKRDTADELALRAAVDSTVVAMIQKRVALSNTSEMQGLEQANRVAMDTLMFKRKVLADELTAVRGNAEEETRITREQALLDQEIKKTRAEQETSEFELAKKGRGAAYDALIKEIDKQQELREELSKNLATENERFDVMVKELETAGALTLEIEKQGEAKPPSFGSQVAGGLKDVFGVVSSTDQNGQVKSQAEFLKGVYADMADGIAGSIGQITGAMSDMLTQMIITGQMSGKAALQMAAGVAIGLALQAGIKAIFEVAEGLAAAANPFTAWQAPMHFAAAKTYAIVAAVAGGAGVGLALGARAAGGGGSSKKSASGGSYKGSSSSSSPKQSEDLTPYSRQSQDAFMSGRHDNTAAMVVRAMDRMDQTLKKFDPMRPGDVLVAGTREKPGHIGATAVKDVRAHAGTGRDLAKAMGIR
jgi:hypothetical protein